MAENTIEVNKDILKEILKLGGINTKDDFSEENLLSAILAIKTKMSSEATDIQISSGVSSNNILVIDDIGVVTYQLKLLLNNIGYNVQTAKDIFSGINSFVKSNFAFLIMDLFVSTEQEGYTLLKETKKIITKNNLDTKIIVITASNKSENKVKCLNGGADIFLKKETGWQDKLVEIIEGHTFQIEE